VRRECYGAPVAHDESMAERVDRLELPFNEFGVDPYGVSKKHVAMAASVLAFLYRYYFRVKCFGIEHVPSRGRAMLVGNHSGGYAIDGAMLLTSLLLEMEPPRLGQGMAEKFLNSVPIASLWTSRTGQFTGLPEHARRLLEDDRILIVFPEGARGTAKLYKERYSLVEFGTGFIRLALQTKSPIVPVGILGGGTAVPTVANLYRLGRLVGVPYIPVTPYLLPLPLPAPVELHYGEPLVFSGTGDEDDDVIAGYVEQVKSRVAGLIEQGREQRSRRHGA
jgi:1-acyl-sn-glycerol-3-phosphate acyltransferase